MTIFYPPMGNLYYLMIEAKHIIHIEKTLPKTVWHYNLTNLEGLIDY